MGRLRQHQAGHRLAPGREALFDEAGVPIKLAGHVVVDGVGDHQAIAAPPRPAHAGDDPLQGGAAMPLALVAAVDHQAVEPVVAVVGIGTVEGEADHAPAVVDADRAEPRQEAALGQRIEVGSDEVRLVAGDLQVNAGFPVVAGDGSEFDHG